MERDTGDGNKLIPLATFFREKLELAERLLIEASCSEPETDDVLVAQMEEFRLDARNTHFQFACKGDGKRVVVRCTMTIEEIEDL